MTRRKELFYHVTSGSNVTRDVHWCVTVFYQPIENDNTANQIHGFTIDYGKFILIYNRPRSLYIYISSNMAPRLSGQTSIFGVVSFVSKSLMGIEGQKKVEKFAILTRKPRSHAWILIYRTWPIIMSRPLKVTGYYVMYDRDAWFLRAIMPSSRALCCLPSVTKQKHEFLFSFNV